MRLLLVEDEKRMAEALCELLRLENMTWIIMQTAGRTGRGSDARMI